MIFSSFFGLFSYVFYSEFYSGRKHQIHLCLPSFLTFFMSKSCWNSHDFNGVIFRIWNSVLNHVIIENLKLPASQQKNFEKKWADFDIKIIENKPKYQNFEKKWDDFGLKSLKTANFVQFRAYFVPISYFVPKPVFWIWQF